MNAPLLLALLACAAQERIVVERDDVVIERDCAVEIGPRAIEDAAGDGVIRIATPGITVDLAGSRLHGAPEGREADSFAGIGILIEAPRVTLRNARVSGFRVGILARKADGLVLEGCDVSGNFRQRLRSTPEAEDASDWLWPHENDGKQWRTNYGAGMCIEDSRGIVVRDCRAREGQNGLILDRVTESKVYDNDFSFLSGWGIAMWRSSDNVVSRNALDFCVRGYSHGIYNRGQDSAGLLMFEQCCRNVIAENSITHGGDGVFAFAGKEALGEAPAPKGFDHKRKGCNDNLFQENDLSFAAAHGLELTFSFDNRIRRNQFVGNAICGIWGGYSQQTQIYFNHFESNGEAGYGLERGGINIEHSTENSVSHNEFLRNACGVRLWWDSDESLMRTPWAGANQGACRGNRISENSFSGDQIGIQVRVCEETSIMGNTFTDVVLDLDTDPAVEQMDGAGWFSIWESLPDLGGTSHPMGARSHLDGREMIVITEWGPFEWETPYLRKVATRGARQVWQWMGREALLDIESVGEVQVEREQGEPFPRILVSSDRQHALVPYQLLARSASGKLRRQGVLSTLRWTLRVFSWTKDPRENEAGWRAQARDATCFEVADLDLSFGMGGASQLAGVPATVAAAGLPADRFGTLAETHVNLPKGRWELTVTSDDGVRVKVDGKTVLEDWTWHPPKTESVELEVERERSFHLEVEHFELDGFAVLKLALAPVD